MSDGDDLVCESKVYNLSTRSTACNVLNGDWKSHCDYFIPNLIDRDETIEYVLFSVPDAIIPVSVFNVNETNNKLVIIYGLITRPFQYFAREVKVHAYKNELQQDPVVLCCLFIQILMYLRRKIFHSTQSF